MRPVPPVDFPQFRSELLGRRDFFQGRVALTIAEEHQLGWVGPSAEVGPILRRIDLGPAVFVAAEPEIIDVAIGAGEFAVILIPPPARGQ